MDWLLKTVQPAKVNQTDIFSIVLEKVSPQEHVKLVTFVDAVTHQAVSSTSSAENRSMILAIICNVESEFEQASLLLVSCATQPTVLLAVLPIVSTMDISISEVTVSNPEPDQLSRFGDDVNQEAPKVLRCRFSIVGDQLIEVSSFDRQALKDAISEIRRLTAIAAEHQIWNPDLLGPWIDRYISRKKVASPSNRKVSPIEVALSARDRLSRLLTSPPISPSATFSPFSSNFPKPPSIAPDLPEWRQNWLNERLRELEDDYVTSKEIKVRVCTWNVFGKQPVESLQDWIVPDPQRDKSDLYVIWQVILHPKSEEDVNGLLQEIDDTPEAYIRYTPQRENFWCEVAQKSIESTGIQKVIKVSSQQLVGLLIIAFVDESIAQDISNVSSAYLGTGTLGMGNKGATAVRLKVCDTYLTLINSHLAAFQEQYEARNRDYLEICRRLTFPTRIGSPRSSVSIPQLRFGGEGPTAPLPSADIFRTGHLIWAGDLNYRLNIAYAEAKALAERSSIEDCNTMLLSDQLKQQIESGKAFQQFQEGNIEFGPTYKFDIGTNNFDTSEKQRIPAYTDRILYLPGRMNDIQILSYDSYPSISLSDHKPVGSTLTMRIYTVMKEKRDQMQNELLRELDGLENEALPDLKVEPEGIEFNFLNSSQDESNSSSSTNLVTNGGELVGSSVELTNLKKFLVAWQLLPKNGETNVCEDWLKISQLSGNLSAGESTQIHFAIDPIGANRRRSQLGSDDLRDVVILSIQGGRDVFIPINVEF
ncbi:hypothetical protein MJO28_012299 [Puccinia striiformis f. sp. tritici]|uniref:Inositol polyphosphate-related phosphatase domain-containing protein n=2 Tax=Puccinia striiformis TaxID=27350 RepID=A0A2S4WJZ8_9BASI|nr:hypothetical protein MJO28_012299 [Puccinia striiformis f. sp. tritici]KAI7945744.1 hypothetical protein MJO29_012132 [Puccinia striiformis f. sp. tritici]POW22079.1 hypothetical protein PSHT_01636 [Puccinia striiformis]